MDLIYLYLFLYVEVYGLIAYSPFRSKDQVDISLKTPFNKVSYLLMYFFFQG